MKGMDRMETLRRKALALGASGAKLIDASSVKTAAWVRNKCRFGCSDGPADPTRIAVRLEREAFLAGFYGGRCRHADRARPAMEACGIDVYRTARGNGFKIEVVNAGHREPDYFSLVLLE